MLLRGREEGILNCRQGKQGLYCEARKGKEKGKELGDRGVLCVFRCLPEFVRSI